MEFNNSKWSELEQTYEKKRRKLVKRINYYDYLDDPIIFMRRQRIASYLVRLKLFEKILDIKGSIVECGVYKGGSLMLYYHLSSIMEPYAINRKIYGFDTFEGIKSISGEKDSNAITESMYTDTDYDVINEAIKINDLNRPIAHIEKCKLIKGDAVETIPEFTNQHPELIIAMLYIDMCVYEPCKTALDYFLPFVPKGGVVAIDGLDTEKWSGNSLAVKEKLNLNKIHLRQFQYDPWVSYFIMGE